MVLNRVGNNVIIILLFLVVVLGIGGVVLLFWIRRTIRRFSRETFGTDSLRQGIEQQKELLSSTPKSVSGMTKIYLPQIQEDFPEFSFPEFVSRSENQLKTYLTAIDQQSMELLHDASAELKKQVSLRIGDNKRQGVREQFQHICIHQTEVSAYRKNAGSCVLVLQSAVEYRYARQSAGETVEPERIQTRYNQEWMYVQDAGKLDSQTTAVGVLCPNCGAPVKNLGQKFCEYCGTALEPVNIRVWLLNRIQES